MTTTLTVAGAAVFTVAEPDACALCGIPQRHHGWRYHGTGSLSRYVTPNDRLRLARMKLRRQERQFITAWQPSLW